MNAMYESVLKLHGHEADGWRHLPIEVTDIPEHVLERIRFGIRVRDSHERVPVTVAKLGDIAGLTDAQLSRYENIGKVTLKLIRQQVAFHQEKWSSAVRGLALTAATAHALTDTASLRDQFAMQALHGIIRDCGLTAEEMADRCYAVADAMIARRNREGQ
jgi:hypothetical protein